MQNAHVSTTEFPAVTGLDTAAKHPTIPHKKGLPLLGVLPELFTKDPFEFLKNLMLEYGDFVAVNLGPQTVYLVSNPDYLQRILRDNYPNYQKPDAFYKSVRRVLGNGLVTSDGDFWLRQRRMIQPHLHRKQLGKLFEDMMGAITEVVDDMAAKAQRGEVVNLSTEMSHITMNVITQTMFGKDTLTPEDMLAVAQDMRILIEFGGKMGYLGFLPEWFPIPGKKDYERALAAVRAKVQKLIDECRLGGETSAGLIKMLLNTVDAETNEQMTDSQIFDEAITIFLAGYETTATVLSWLWIILNERHDVLAKLRAEVDSVLGGRLPEFADVPKLTYARQVFLETMRMYTVAPMLPRTLKAADTLGDYELPANAMVIVFYHGVHHNPQVWDNPEYFDPERFNPEQASHHHAFAFVPFSAGPRKCAGEDFAMLEGPLVMAALLQRFDMHVLPGQDFSPKFGSTLRPRDGVKATLNTRELQPAE